MSNDLLLHDDLAWFAAVRSRLLNEWQTKTVVSSGKGDVESLACSILQAVNISTGHLSLACSLQSEAAQIEKLLNTICFDDDPVLFFRLFLFLLDEFTDRMQECSNLIQQRAFPEQPKLISVWTNRYAKHRTAILIQHHAQHLFEDEPEFGAAIAKLKKHGKIEFIDTAWLKTPQKADIAGANRDLQSVVIIPPLIHFLLEAIQYYSDFRQFACSAPKALEQFQSEHHWKPIDLTEAKS
jgi:hypothetical protein